MTKATVCGDRIECGKCGALLMKVIEVSPSKFEIKCKHKDKGKTCNEMNLIETK